VTCVCSLTEMLCRLNYLLEPQFYLHSEGACITNWCVGFIETYKAHESQFWLSAEMLQYYLFICFFCGVGLFIDLISNYIPSNDGLSVNSDSSSMWKKAVLIKFAVISLDFPGGNEKSHEKPQSL
jgi:hypothetical protein